jgi:indole-3-acetate monooxygenase
MTRNETEPTLEAVQTLGPLIEQYRDQIEEGRRLPTPLVDALRKAGVFRMPMPQAWDGPELSLTDQIRVLETLSRFDASVGWCAMIGCDGGYVTAFLDDQDVARQMYEDLDAITGWAATVTGRAQLVPGGYRLSGRWPFSSGCQHATSLIAGCFVYEGDQQRFTANGSPEARQCFLPARDAKILDTWYTTGLRGSGSNDWTLDDYFVPAERTFDFQNLKFSRPGPLYAFPLTFALKSVGVYLGVAQAALDALLEAANRPARRMTVGFVAAPEKELKDEDYFQEAVGRAEALITAARSYAYTVASDFYDTLARLGEPTPKQLTHVYLLNAQVADMCTQAVALLYKARGGSVVYSHQRLERCFRDMETMNQHVVNSLRSYGMAGRAMLGFPPEGLFL